MIKLMEASFANLLLNLSVTAYLYLGIILGPDLLLALLPQFLRGLLNHLLTAPSPCTPRPAILLRLQHSR